MHYDLLPEVGFLRINQILEILPVAKSTWWQGVKDGRFPQPVKLGRITMWRAEDIRELLETIQ